MSANHTIRKTEQLRHVSVWPAFDMNTSSCKQCLHYVFTLCVQCDRWRDPTLVWGLKNLLSFCKQVIIKLSVVSAATFVPCYFGFITLLLCKNVLERLVMVLIYCHYHVRIKTQGYRKELGPLQNIFFILNLNLELWKNFKYIFRGPN